MKVVDVESVLPEGVSHDPAIRKRVLLRSGEVPHVAQLARTALQPGQTARDHAHRDMWEVFFCESGNGTMTVNGASIALRAGTCVVVEPGEHHEVTNDRNQPLVLTVVAVTVEPGL